MKHHVTPRRAALDTLLAIEAQGQPLDAALRPVYEAGFSPADRGFARQLVMTALRRAGQLDAAIAPYLKKKLTKKLLPALWVLRLGAAQLLLLNTPPHAAIDSSVRLCKAAGFRHQAGLVNAVLRQLARDRPALCGPLANLPDWLRTSWRAAYGQAALVAIAEQITREPPLDLQLKPDADFPQDEALLPGMRRLPACDVTQLPGYETGDWWVQDLAAGLPVRALGELRGRQVFDLCAAPGGKTMQLAAAGAEVVAVDRSAARLERLRDNLARTRLAATLVEADLCHWHPETMPDFVLLDAPCSATGTIRRHPDMLYTKTPEDVAQMVTLQRAILSQLLRWLPDGVPLLYAVCSLQPEEGEAQIDWLRAQDATLRLQPLEAAAYGWPPEWQRGDGTIRTLPHYCAKQGGMDGFFIARLVRQ